MKKIYYLYVFHDEDGKVANIQLDEREDGCCAMHTYPFKQCYDVSVFGHTTKKARDEHARIYMRQIRSEI